MGFFDSNEHKEGEGGVDDWLMSYADMITLMLCFFAMFLAVSVPKQESMEEARKEVAEVFSDNQEQKGASKFISVLENDKQQKMDTGTGGGGSLSSIMERYRNAGGEMNLHQEGDKITIIEMDSSLFFSPGSAELGSAGKHVLEDIGENLMSDKFEGYTITIEGHTDDIPISTAQFPSNWELSAARASAVVRYFIVLGIPPKRLRATGYAETQPKSPNRDLDGIPIPRHQAQNRRVVLRLERVDKLN